MIVPSVHPAPGDAELRTRLLQLIAAFGKPRIAVVGDLIADEFIYGRIDRVSREAPVLILNYDATEVMPGGAGNAAQNVAALGADARLVGLVGRDTVGRRLTRSFRKGVKRIGLVRPLGYCTCTKTRILAGGIHSARQQVVRIDRDASSVEGQAREALLRAAVTAVEGCNAVVLSDYGGGVVTPRLVAAMKRHMPRRGRWPAAPILLDSRYGLLRFGGLTIAAPNESEVEQLLGVTIDDDPRALEQAGRAILKQSRLRAVLITRGSRGMALFEPGRRTQHIGVYGSNEVADVTGAGDTVIATMALALSVGASYLEAALLATYAGGLVVMKRGTASVTAAELEGAVEDDLG